MTMSEFIEVHMEAILSDWEDYAKTLLPGSGEMTRAELRDLAEQILRSVVADMQTPQTESQRHQKSLGASGDSGTRGVSEIARGHATERLAGGFTLNQVVAEYRALRASVIRRWRKTEKGTSAELEELTRFNEAIDESLAEAVSWYNNRLQGARDLLSGVLAHDLNNPLGAMLTGAEVLLEDESLKAQQISTAALIRRSGTRMRKMIDDLLDFTRTRLGTGLPMTKSRNDLAEILGNVIDELAVFHPEATLEWKTTGDLTSFFDPARIEQMLSNLIANAILHGIDGTPITITAQGTDNELIVKVHNQGEPISRAEQEVVFEPLRRAAMQVKEGRTKSPAQGLGLGLYIVREIVQAHGGWIEVDSSKARGTTFTVQLPRESNGGVE